MPRQNLFPFSIYTLVAIAGLNAQSLPTLDIPKSIWEPIFFESINRVAKNAELPNLRTTPVNREDFECRVWEGFGISPLHGYVLRRTNGTWSAIELEDQHSRVLKPSKSHVWARLWEELLNAGIRSIRDESKMKHNEGVMDGICYVVEILENSKYQTFMVDNPQIIKSSDGARMLKVMKILHRHF